MLSYLTIDIDLIVFIYFNVFSSFCIYIPTLNTRIRDPSHEAPLPLAPPLPVLPPRALGLAPPVMRRTRLLNTAGPRAEDLGFGGSDSRQFMILGAGTPRSMGNIPETQTQRDS